MLAQKLSFPITHLGMLWWKPGWVEGTLDEFCPKVIAAVAQDRWIIDSNFSRTFDIRMPRADTIIWIDQPRWLCLWRAFWRTATHFGRNRPDLAPGFLAIAEEVMATGKSPGDILLDAYHGRWNGKVDPVFQEYAF